MSKPDDLGSSSKSSNHTLHPAYSVTNIQSKIRTLDGTKVTYSSWVKLFKFHAIAYKVLDHLDDTPTPASTDPNYDVWKELDALVSQWIYSTVSDDLLTRILDIESTARETWLKLEKIFLSNKQAKAAALDARFVNLTLAACTSVDDYCQQLKEIANQLVDVDQPVTDKRLVLQLVRGLSTEFDTTAQLIHSQAADWDLARTMLHDEVLRREARQQKSTSVLVAPAAPTSQLNQNPTNTQQPVDPNSNQFQSYRGRGRGRGQNYRGRGSRGRGSKGSSGNNWAFQHSSGQQSYPQWAWWNTPPCPYPTQTSWRPNQTSPYPPPNSAPSAHYAGYPNPMPYGPIPAPQAPTFATGLDALNPSDLSAAFNTMQLNYTDPNAIMDTGAEGHVTNNRGPQNWAPTFPPQ
ncbi:hypothetical protein L1987_42738 [Smallanthus sonchifolius]|uniref:Uncharacterized protein n=1 Tax=Smallanthus sonchifolius TaxID=185202 RepID=A0ACB9GJK5_9ASTR|nr:hypothetical protein L1987_42738 [Smallanthus sonchifolius]